MSNNEYNRVLCYPQFSTFNFYFPFSHTPIFLTPFTLVSMGGVGRTGCIHFWGTCPSARQFRLLQFLPSILPHSHLFNPFYSRVHGGVGVGRTGYINFWGTCPSARQYSPPPSRVSSAPERISSNYFASDLSLIKRE